MEYRVFWKPYGGVLEKNRDEGVIFVDKNAEPVDGFAVYNIVHRGLDRNKRPYAIATPVMRINSNEMLALCREASYASSWNIGVHKLRLERAFPGFNCYDLVSIVKLCEKVGQDAVVVAAYTMPDCSNECFTVCSDSWSNHRIKTYGLVRISYTNGEEEFQTACWVFKNRDRLINTEIVVYGNTADSLLMEFHSV